MEEDKSVKKHNLFCIIAVVVVVLGIIAYIIYDYGTNESLKNSRKLKKEIENSQKSYDETIKNIDKKYDL